MTLNRLYLSNYLLFYSLMSLLCIAHIALGDSKISDAQKKEFIYRMSAGYEKDFPTVKEIFPQQAMELLDQGEVVFVDTRKPAEMAVSMLPCTVSKQNYLSHPDQYKNKTTVCYCTIGKRSCVFAREMTKQGITFINLKGGILAWILEDGKVYDKNGKEVKQVHIYGDKWDYAPAGYETVKFSLWNQLF